MANGLLAYGNLVDDGVVQDGFWMEELPLANLQDRQLGVVARSRDLALSSTKFVFDAGPFPTIRVIDLVGHNLSLDAKVRVRSSPVSNFASIGVDTGWLDVWPTVYPFGTIPWGAPNWWDRRYTAKQVASLKREKIIILSQDSFDQYWLVEFDDQTNLDGYVELARPFFGPAIQWTTNFSFGAGLGVEDVSQIDQALSGAEYFDERTKRRSTAFNTDWLEEDEALAEVFEMQLASGITKEVVFVWNPDDTIHFQRRSFLGRLGKLDRITNPYVSVHKAAHEIKELI
ncbi:hypothetical protein [Phenylobacterium sp.]|uniref:hypothetical protein n=1 Tax=Phenylobacterium sp. TaxID=1871053 RepID=UPI0035B1B66C